MVSSAGNAQVTRLKWQQSVTYFTGFVVLGVAGAAMGPILPDLAQALNVSLAEVSDVLALGSAGYLGGSFLGGYLLDRIPGNRMMLVYFTIIAVFMTALSFMPGLLWMMAIMFFLGLAQGAIDVSGNTLLVWVHGDNVGSFMNALHFFFGLGAAIAPVVIGQLLAVENGLRWSLAFVAFCAVPVIVLMWVTPGPRNRVAVHTTFAVDGLPANDAKRTVIIILFALLFFLYVGAEGVFGRWIATYARVTGLANATMAANLTSVFWGALTIGRLLSIPVATRVQSRSLIGADLVGLLCSAFAIILFTHTHWLLWLGTAGAGLSMASIFPAMMSLAEQHLKLTGKISGVFFVSSSLGGLVLPWAVGRLFEHRGPAIMVQAILINVIVECVVFSILWVSLQHKFPSQENS